MNNKHCTPETGLFYLPPSHPLLTSDCDSVSEMEGPILSKHYAKKKEEKNLYQIVASVEGKINKTQL